MEPRRIFAERGGGRVAVAAAPCEVIVCDPAEARVVTRFWADDKAVGVGFAAGRVVTQERVGGGTRRVVRDVDAGDEEALGGDDHAVGPLTPDGRWMLRHLAPLVELVDLRDGRALRLHDGHETLVRDLAWSAEGALLATLAVNGAVRVWDLRGPELLWQFESAARVELAVAFSPDRQHLYGVGSSLVAWGLDDGAERQRVALADADFAPVPRCRVAVSPDGQHLLTNVTWTLVLVEQPAHAAQVREHGYGGGTLGLPARGGRGRRAGGGRAGGRVACGDRPPRWEHARGAPRRAALRPTCRCPATERSPVTPPSSPASPARPPRVWPAPARAASAPRCSLRARRGR